MSETIKVSDYIEQKYKQLKSRFSDFEWLKLYLETVIAQRELHLVDKFFSIAVDYSIENSKWRCANLINGIFYTLVGHADSKLLDEILVASTATNDEKFLIASALCSFLIQDLLNIVIDYSFSVKFEVGMYVDAQDADGKWYVGEIKQILQYKNDAYLFMHNVECSNWYDECIRASSKRIKLLYDDSGQVVYKWPKILSSEVAEVDYTIVGQSNWKRCTKSEVECFSRRCSKRVIVAPAGTFIKHVSFQHI